MALSNIFEWDKKDGGQTAAACGTACGAGDSQENPTACGTACGAGEPEDK